MNLRNNLDLKLVLGITKKNPVEEVFISFKEDSIQSSVPNQSCLPPHYVNYESCNNGSDDERIKNNLL